MEKLPQGTGIFYVEATANSPSEVIVTTPFEKVENAIKAGALPILRYEYGSGVYFKHVSVYTPGVDVNFNGTRVKK